MKTHDNLNLEDSYRISKKCFRRNIFVQTTYGKKKLSLKSIF